MGKSLQVSKKKNTFSDVVKFVFLGMFSVCSLHMYACSNSWKELLYTHCKSGQMAVNTSHILPWPCKIHSSREWNVIFAGMSQGLNLCDLCAFMCVSAPVFEVIFMRALMQAYVCRFTYVLKKKGCGGDEGVEQARLERYQACFCRPPKCNRVCKTRTGSDDTFVDNNQIKIEV